MAFSWQTKEEEEEIGTDVTPKKSNSKSVSFSWQEETKKKDEETIEISSSVDDAISQLDMGEKLYDSSSIKKCHTDEDEGNIHLYGKELCLMNRGT